MSPGADLVSVLAGCEDDRPGLARALHPGVDQLSYLLTRHTAQAAQDLARDKQLGALSVNVNITAMFRLFLLT